MTVNWSKTCLFFKWVSSYFKRLAVNIVLAFNRFVSTFTPLDIRFISFYSFSLFFLQYVNIYDSRNSTSKTQCHHQFSLSKEKLPFWLHRNIYDERQLYVVYNFFVSFQIWNELFSIHWHYLPFDRSRANLCHVTEMLKKKNNSTKTLMYCTL